MCPSLAVPHKFIGFFHLMYYLLTKKTYVILFFREFSVNANKPKIQREIPGSFVIRGEKQKNDIDNNLNKEGGKVKSLTRVYY